MNVQHRGLVLLVLAVVAATGVHAQLIEPTNLSPATRERTIAHWVDDGMLRRALDAARRQALLLQGRPGSVPSTFDVSRSQWRTQEGQAADRTLQRWASRHPNDPSVALALIERGTIALLQHDPAGAVPLFAEAADKAEQDLTNRKDDTYHAIVHRARFWQGASLALNGRSEEAISVLRAAATMPNAGEYADLSWYAVGQLHERARRFDSAIAAYAQVRTKYPTSPTVLASRIREAQCLLTLRRPERALDALAACDDVLLAREMSDTTRFAPQRYAEDAAEETLLLRAAALTQRRSYRQALDSSMAFRSLYRWSGLRWNAALYASINALHLGSADTALAMSSAVVDSAPVSDVRDQALLYRGLALKQSKRRLEALEVFQSLGVQSGYPYQAQALVEAGQIKYEDGEYDKARQLCERAVKVSMEAVTTVRAELLHGAALVELSEWRRASAAYDHALTVALSAEDAFMPYRSAYLAEARLKRGICQVQASASKDAIRSLTEFLAEHPQDPRRDEATFWLAESMYREDLLRNAQELYEEVVNRYAASGRREEAIYGLAWTAFRKRDFAQSVKLFTQLVTLYPTSRHAAEALTRKGDGLYVMRQFHAAAESYAEAARRAPGSEDGQYAAFQVGQSRYRAGESIAARESMLAFAKRYPKSPLADNALYVAGWINFTAQQFSEAVVMMERIITEYPTSDHAVRALYTMGDAKYNMGDQEGAIAAYRQVIARFPSHALAAEAAKSLQIALIDMDRTEEALAVADTFIAANPQSIAAEAFAIKKAEIFYSGRNYTSAAAELNAYLARGHSALRRDEALYMLGRTYLTLDDTKQAEQAFQSIEKEYPSSPFVPQSMLELASYRAQHAQGVTADSIYAILMQRYGRDTSIASRSGFERAALLRTRGDTVTALQQFMINADRYAGSEYGDQSRYQIAMHHRKLKQYDSARYHFSLLAQRVDFPLLAAEAWYRIGELYVREKKHEDAIIAFRSVRDLYAGNEDWYTLSLLGMGEALEQLGRSTEAIDAYMVVSEIRPEDDYGKAAQARLKRLKKRTP